MAGCGNVNLIRGAEVTGHRSGSNKKDRYGHNILHFEHNLLFYWVI
jgi:hypothetical protein